MSRLSREVLQLKPSKAKSKKNVVIVIFTLGQGPVLESPPEPASQNLRLLGACVFFDKFWFSWFDGLPSELRQLTWQVLFPILATISLKNN